MELTGKEGERMDELTIDETLSQGIQDILQHLIEEDFEAPFYFAAIGSNGHTITGFFEWTTEGDMEPTFTSEYVADKKGLQFPVNMMFTDKAGRAARMLISQSGSMSKPKFLH